MKDIIKTCRSCNTTVDRMMSSDMTLDGWLEHEIGKLKGNCRIAHVLKKDDLIDECCSYIGARLSDEAAHMVGSVMESGIFYTADHLGGLYSAQSFQGDLLYARLLKKLHGDLPCVPMVSFGLVPINSSTYARGLIAYSRTDEAEHIPLLPKMPTNAAASLSDAFTSLMARSTKDKALARVKSYLVKKKIREVMENLYQSDGVLSQKRFADQVLFLGEGLYERLCPTICQGNFWHMEAESIFASLFMKDYSERGGFIRDFLLDPKTVRALNEIADDEGRKLSGLIFRGCSDRRCFALNLDEDGKLRGTDVNAKSYEFSMSEDELGDAIKSRQVLPHVYLSWLLSSYLRGFTWFGGILQSVYLQDWNKRTCEMMESLGYEDIANPRRDFDDSGYLSGPIYMLFDTGDGAVNAGPFELMAKPITPERYNALFETDMKSAHEMGCFEFYNDIAAAAEKGDNWYERIAAYAKEHYSAYTLQNLQDA
ncbi:MAG: hypothetical protein K6F73_11010 [Lachnospiraceae bacterium]|nr:hypothetical protein [Lachnospiraceae bacterium]